MSELKHTPGPWLLAGEDKTFVYALGPNGTNVFWTQVAAAGRERASRREMVANARLIAAAPELLEALRAILDFGNEANTRRGRWAVDKARAAIAKAKGESHE